MFGGWTGHIKLHHACKNKYSFLTTVTPPFLQTRTAVLKAEPIVFPKPNGIADQRLLNPKNPKYCHLLQNPESDIRKAILSLNSPFAVWLLSERRAVIVVSSRSALISYRQGPTPIYASKL